MAAEHEEHLMRPQHHRPIPMNLPRPILIRAGFSAAGERAWKPSGEQIMHPRGLLNDLMTEAQFGRGHRAATAARLARVARRRAAWESDHE